MTMTRWATRTTASPPALMVRRAATSAGPTTRTASCRARTTRASRPTSRAGTRSSTGTPTGTTPTATWPTCRTNSSIADVTDWQMTYNGLSLNATTTEIVDPSEGADRHYTYGYYPNGALKQRTYDSRVDSFEYNSVDLVSKVTNADFASDPNAEVTTYTYTPRGQLKLETRGPGDINTV